MQEVSRFVSEHVAPMDRIHETATHIVMKSYKENGNTLFEQQETERLPYSFKFSSMPLPMPGMARTFLGSPMMSLICSVRFSMAWAALR